MLDANIKIIDIDADHWKRLILLFERDEARPTILFLIMEGQMCLKAIHSKKGAVRPFDYGDGDLEKIRQRHSVDFVAVVGRDFLQRAFYEGESKVAFDEDYVKQLIDIYNGVTAYTEQNIQWHPHRPRIFRKISPEKAQKVFDKLWPDNQGALFLVIDHGRPHTSLILGKENGHISQMTTLDAFGLCDKPFNARTDRKELLEKIEKRFFPVFFALVIEKRCFEELIAGGRPLTFLHAAQKHGRAILDPLPAKLRLGLWLARVFKKM